MQNVIEGETYFNILQKAFSFLEKNEKSTYAAEWLLCERMNWTKTDLINHYKQKMPLDEQERFMRDVYSFNKGLPMQQIIGHEWFYGRKFKVTKDTLIPRPETEEWIEQVFEKLPNKPQKVLDIGTGTGVLAITQKLERPDDQVTATDINEKTLEIAKVNATKLGANITFKQGDLLSPICDEKFNVILCNPPYISVNEKDLMDASVLEHEPKEALFAKNDGLEIYKRLSHSLSKNLEERFFIFLEIGFRQGQAVKKLFERTFPKADIEIWKDYNQNDRVVTITNEK